VASPPTVETWPCPAPGCGRDVHRVNPALKGYWIAPVPSELLARCAREHGAHDRAGRPFPPDEPWSGGPEALATASLLDLGAGRFVVLTAPPLVLVADATGASFVVRVLAGASAGLAPSDLVGTGLVDRTVAAGEVAAADLFAGLDDEPGTVRLAPLARFLER
jgi:hypothetical protein